MTDQPSDIERLLTGMLRAIDMFEDIIGMARNCETTSDIVRSLGEQPFSFPPETAHVIVSLNVAQLARESRNEMETELAALRSGAPILRSEYGRVEVARTHKSRTLRVPFSQDPDQRR